ncbi:MAG: UDP-N-acetylglucosamine 2-epimerase [Cloacibacterium sp.]|uniref:UDP-N-acetylglucosamine 2-epimerase n=1 Tax=Cloacibacterium sp. TaxID=1913682 RepID=UPI003C769D14
MGRFNMIRVGVLTSSRADFGIYLPLLKALQKDEEFNLELIVFGTHLSKFHGYTVEQIEREGFKIAKRVESLLLGDTPSAIASAYGLTALKFAEYWQENEQNFDVVFALGDRFEMAAAVDASIPFGIKIAHLHGGETTLGAIDNIYRHSISLASQWHFVAAKPFAKRLNQLLDDEKASIYNVGSLSLENLKNIDFLSLEEFENKWQIDLNIKTILVTVHPETVAYQKNLIYCEETIKALDQLANDFQIVITMPNADTAGMVFRKAFEALAQKKKTIKIIENFGTQSYFTCMKYAKLMVGNTSSGIVEAASFQKYVLNLGERQKDRLCGENVIHVPFNQDLIVKNALQYAAKVYNGENVYFKSNPSETIIQILKKEYASIS